MVHPDTSKVDLPHLPRDATKYNEAGMLTASAHLWWQEFIKDFDQMYGATPPEDQLPTWPLMELLQVCKSHLRHPPTSPPPEIPSIIEKMHKNQLEERPKVTAIL